MGSYSKRASFGEPHLTNNFILDQNQDNQSNPIWDHAGLNSASQPKRVNFYNRQSVGSIQDELNSQKFTDAASTKNGCSRGDLGNVQGQMDLH